MQGMTMAKLAVPLLLGGATSVYAYHSMRHDPAVLASAKDVAHSSEPRIGGAIAVGTVGAALTACGVAGGALLVANPSIFHSPAGIAGGALAGAIIIAGSGFMAGGITAEIAATLAVPTS